MLENETLTVYPNPGPGLIVMDLPSAGQYEVKVYTTDGRMVLTEYFDSAGGARSINISGENDGIYFLHVAGPETDETVSFNCLYLISSLEHPDWYSLVIYHSSHSCIFTM
jgi:hypothetical protein